MDDIANGDTELNKSLYGSIWGLSANGTQVLAPRTLSGKNEQNEKDDKNLAPQKSLSATSTTTSSTTWQSEGRARRTAPLVEKNGFGTENVGGADVIYGRSTGDPPPSVTSC